MADWNIKFHKVISLGPACETTYYIRRLIDQDEAYVFDWVIAPPMQVAKAIQSDFSDFIMRDGLEYCSGEAIGHPYINDSILGIEFHHDFRNDADFMDSYESVAKKYAFLIERFREVCTCGKSILFVQQHATETEARALDAAITARFPNLTYRLLVLDIAPQWPGDGRVRAVAINYEGSTWDERFPVWRDFLRDLLSESFSAGFLRLRVEPVT
jgi:hypothetical protein